jgi:phage major head subunit gpT-like protein
MYPGLHKVYMLNYASYPSEYEQFLNIETSTKRQEEDAVVAGFGLVPEKGEGVQPSVDIMALSDKLQYLHKTYALGYEVTEECQEDELYGIVSRASKALAIAVKQTLDVLGASVLNNGFNAAYKGVDGLSLFNANHTQLKVAGGVLSNMPAVTCDFDPTTLNSALESWETLTDDNGLPLMIKPKYVISGPKQRRIITQTLGTDLQPFTNDNEINAVKEWELQKMILHYLTDDDFWALLSRKDDHYLKMFWRIKPAFRGYDDPNTGNAKYMVRFRASHGFTHWWGTYGSAGI